MSTWKELLFGNLVGFSAVMVIGFIVLMGVFLVVAYLKLSSHGPDESGTQDSPSATADPERPRKAA
ncbi:MAG: DUF3149 domain-containing protein [Deltaproteobacteria bacterium]|nr:DUF3149 domain-containing protein [Deltaproteobacteria bacterium]